MAVESMRTEGEAVYEVVEEGSAKRWRRILRTGPHGESMVEVAGMYAEGRDIGTRLRVKTTTVAKIEKPKRAAK